LFSFQTTNKVPLIASIRGNLHTIIISAAV
jgi:hypothetical protein